MTKLFLGVLLLGVMSSTCAEEVKVKQSNLVFEVSAQHIAELAAANLKLYKRYPDEIKEFGPVSFQSAYVASIIGQSGLKYIFVGFPMQHANATYVTVIQYCENEEIYQFEQYGLNTGDIKAIYNDFVKANNTSLTKLSDSCKAHSVED